MTDQDEDYCAGGREVCQILGILTLVHARTQPRSKLLRHTRTLRVG